MKLSHLVKDGGGIALYTLGARGVQRLERPGLVRLADHLGDALRRLSPDDCAVMEEELLGTVDVTALDRTPREVVRRAWRLRTLCELEVLRYPVLGPGTIDQAAVLEGRHHLDRALERGRGAIVMLGHFGANQLVMPALGHRGYAMNQLSAPPTAWADIRVDDRVNRLWELVQRRRWRLEQQLPTEHIDVFGFLRPAFRCLERGEVLGLAFDGGGGRRWIPMPLGRRTATVSMQPWQLARSTGAPVVPTVVVHEPGDTAHRVVLGEPLTVPRGSDRRADVTEAASRYGRWFSAHLQARPCHYLHYLLLRRRVAASDDQPLFHDYPHPGTP